MQHDQGRVGWLQTGGGVSISPPWGYRLFVYPWYSMLDTNIGAWYYPVLALQL